jgi:hypothetical protein
MLKDLISDAVDKSRSSADRVWANCRCHISNVLFPLFVISSLILSDAPSRYCCNACLHFGDDPYVFGLDTVTTLFSLLSLML